MEETGGKRVLGRGRRQGEWDPISHELCEVFIVRVVGRILCQLGHFCLPQSKGWTEEDQRGNWETSEDGQGRDLAGWGGGRGHGDILEVRLVGVALRGTWVAREGRKQ